MKKRIAHSVADIAGAHHGIPSGAVEDKRAGEVIADYPEQWKTSHRELMDAMADFTGIRPVLPQLRRLNADAAEVITGFVIMVDWIVSNPDFFPMTVGPELHPEGPSQRLRHAMRELDLPPLWIASPSDTDSPEEFYRRAFGWEGGRKPRPVQQVALESARDAPAGAALFIVEAPTGEGKTEAGLAIAEVRAARNGAQGVMMAAPTMSTANGLLGRFIDWAGRVTPDVEVKSMFLAHSKNKLSTKFKSLPLRGINEDGPRRGAEGGNVVANQWLSGTKRACWLIS